MDMGQLTVASFNIEWMVSLFGARWRDWDGTIPSTFRGRRLGEIRLEPIEDTVDLARRIGATITALEADIVCIQEGPPRRDQLQLFADRFLGGDYTAFVSNSRWQTIGALVRNRWVDDVAARDSNTAESRALWGGIGFYPWGRIALEERVSHSLYRRPLYLRVALPNGTALQILNLHTKSKWSALQRPEQWEEREEAAVRDALLSRQKLSAEVSRIREFSQAILHDESDSDHLVLLGDLNDGPLAEELEREFLIHNIIDELVGSVVEPQTLMRHAMSSEALRHAHTTEFRNPLRSGALTRELLDHVLISPALAACGGDVRLRPGSCVVNDEAYDANVDADRGADVRQLRPSDHRPVSAVFEFAD